MPSWATETHRENALSHIVRTIDAFPRRGLSEDPRRSLLIKMTNAQSTHAGVRRCSLSITHPTGVCMKYSEKLAAFLFERSRDFSAVSFGIGLWLRTLAGEELKELQELGDSQLSGEPIPGKHPHASDDFVQLAIIALAAEKQSRSVEITPKVLTALGLCTALERLSRDGLVEIDGTLTLDQLASAEA